MNTKRSTALKVLSSLGLAGLLLLGLDLSLGLAQGPFTQTRVTTSSDGTSRSNGIPSLSADGTKVAFHSDSDFLGQGIPEFQYEIWLFDTATMTLTRITTSSDGAKRISFGPSLNANGTKVAFVSDSDFLEQGILEGQFEIWLYDTATMTLTRVTTTSGPNQPYYNLSLSTDGTKAAFVSDSDFLGQGIPQSQYEIWLYDTATMTLTRVTTSSDGPNRGSAGPRLNADGTKVAFVSDSDFLGQGIPEFEYEIWLFDTATMTLTRVTTTSGPNRHHYNPSLNADGTKVAFSSDSDFLEQGIL